MPAYNISKVLEKTASTILDYVQNIQKTKKTRMLIIYITALLIMLR